VEVIQRGHLDEGLEEVLREYVGGCGGMGGRKKWGTWKLGRRLEGAECSLVAAMAALN